MSRTNLKTTIVTAIIAACAGAGLTYQLVKPIKPPITQSQETAKYSLEGVLYRLNELNFYKPNLVKSKESLRKGEFRVYCEEDRIERIDQTLDAIFFNPENVPAYERLAGLVSYMDPEVYMLESKKEGLVTNQNRAKIYEKAIQFNQNNPNALGSLQERLDSVKYMIDHYKKD